MAAGILASLLLARLVGALVPEVAASDPASYLAAAALVAGAALLASWLPARRTASTDPMAALRSE